MTTRAALAAFRSMLGLLALTAIARQFAIHVGLGFSAVNFFSYFTNLANLFASLVLIGGAARVASPRPPTAAGARFRGAAVVYMAVVGIVFATLLRGVDLGALLPWVNAVLHYVMPVAVVLDWLVWPPRTALGARDVLRWLVVPLLYVAYTLARGAATGWYPYPFLNPTTVGGYGAVAAYAAAITLVFAAVGASVVAIGNRRGRVQAAAAA